MADDSKTPLDRALDLFVYAPLGLAFTARDELPSLVEKGRQRLGMQLTMAKMIGQFAVVQGQKEAEKAADRLVEQVGTVASRLGGLPGVPGTSGGAAAAVRSAEAPTAPSYASQAPAVNGTHTNGTNGSTARTTAPVGPPADSLAIPGYDSLSASQVVQRLGGLSPAELQSVGRYEDANRGRRTILAKVAQLQAERR